MFYPWGDVWEVQGSGGYNFANIPYRDVTTTTDITTARFSSPNFGRWLSPDPIGVKAVKLNDPQTWNMYAYVRNNPTTLTDPSGLAPSDPRANWPSSTRSGARHLIWMPASSFTLACHPLSQMPAGSGLHVS